MLPWSGGNFPFDVITELNYHFNAASKLYNSLPLCTTSLYSHFFFPVKTATWLEMNSWRKKRSWKLLQEMRFWSQIDKTLRSSRAPDFSSTHNYTLTHTHTLSPSLSLSLSLSCTHTQIQTRTLILTLTCALQLKYPSIILVVIRVTA